MQSCLARVMPEAFELLFQRAPQPGEVDALVSLAGGDGIGACMGDHASNEQRRPRELAKLLGKAEGEIEAKGCACWRPAACLASLIRAQRAH